MTSGHPKGEVKMYMQSFGAVLVAGISCIQQNEAVVLVCNLEKESLAGVCVAVRAVQGRKHGQADKGTCWSGSPRPHHARGDEECVILKLHLGANSELKVRCAVSPVTLAWDVDTHVHFMSYLGTTGKIKGNKGSFVPLPAVRPCFAAGCPVGLAVRLLILMC